MLISSFHFTSVDLIHFLYTEDIQLINLIKINHRSRCRTFAITITSLTFLVTYCLIYCIFLIYFIKQTKNSIHLSSWHFHIHLSKNIQRHFIKFILADKWNSQPSQPGCLQMDALARFHSWIIDLLTV